MPIVEVVYSSRVTEPTLVKLAKMLPHAVSMAVDCPEEPYDHELRPGDVEIRFRALGQLDITGLDAVVEVRSKWFESRAMERQERCQLLHDLIADAVDIDNLGVYLSLPVAAWAQTD